jgi:hypothetical protein
MQSRAPRAVRELLVSALPQLEDRLLVETLRRQWGRLVGAEAARRSQPYALVNGCLHVRVDNSPWLAELTLLAPELTARLAAEFEAVRSLRLSLGAPPVEEPRSAPPPAARGAYLTERDRRALDAAVAAIADPALAASARRLLGRAWPPSSRGNQR